MNSLLKHVADLDRLENNQKASLASYAAALEHMEQYAIEIEPSVAEAHRKALLRIRQRVTEAQTPEGLTDTQVALRLELREYQDKCKTHLSGLRQNFTSALLSLQDVMTSLSSSGQDQEKNVREELGSLEGLVEAADSEVLRRAVRVSVKRIAEFVEVMRREKEVTVAQFKDEIRTMQKRMDAAEATAAFDLGTGALTRTEFENRVRKDVLRDTPVCLVMLKITNFRDIQSRHGKYLAGEGIKALFLRIREQLGDKLDIGRWNDSTLTVKLNCRKPDVVKLSRELGNRISLPFVCLEEGSPYTLSLRSNVGIAEFSASEHGDQFLARVGSLCDSMG